MAGSLAGLPTEVLWPSHMVERLPLQQLSQLRRVCRSLNQTCGPVLLQRDREVREAFNDMVSRVRKVLEGLPEDLQEEGNEQKAVDVWDLMTWLKGKCSTILEVLEVTRDKYLGTEVVNGDVSEILADIVQRARQEAVGDIRTLHVEAACIFIHAARRIEELLQPIVLPRLVSGLHSSSVVLYLLMHPPSEIESVYSVTDQTRSRTRPSQPRQFPGTITEDTGGAWPEDLALPESMPGGTDLAKLQELEHQLLEARARQPGDSQELALILARLGQVKMNLGHQAEAIEHLNESLQLQRSLRPGDSMEVALILTRLGQMNRLQGHDAEAIEQLKESLRMQQSLHGDCDHEGIADTLHQLGVVTAHTGDLKEALWYMKESLRIERSLHGDIQHPGIADALHELGNVTAQTGDLKEALRYLKESLRMKQSLHGDIDHPDIALTLHMLGDVTAQTGDWKEALRCLKESLRMQRSLHGDGDHPDIAGDLKEAHKYRQELSQMVLRLQSKGCVDWSERARTEKDADLEETVLDVDLKGPVSFLYIRLAIRSVLSLQAIRLVTAATGNAQRRRQKGGGGMHVGFVPVPGLPLVVSEGCSEPHAPKGGEGGDGAESSVEKEGPVSTMRASLAAGVRWALGRPREAEEAPEARKEAGVASAVRKPERVSTGQELAGKAWCRSCERSDFGRFCPQCGQHLVHEVVTPSGHYRLTAEVEEGTVSPPKAKSTLPFQSSAEPDTPWSERGSVDQSFGPSDVDRPEASRSDVSGWPAEKQKPSISEAEFTEEEGMTVARSFARKILPDGGQSSDEEMAEEAQKPEPDRKSLSELEDEDLDVLVEETLGNWRRAEEHEESDIELLEDDQDVVVEELEDEPDRALEAPFDQPPNELAPKSLLKEFEASPASLAPPAAELPAPSGEKPEASKVQEPASLAPPAELPAPSGEKPEAVKVQESTAPKSTRGVRRRTGAIADGGRRGGRGEDGQSRNLERRGLFSVLRPEEAEVGGSKVAVSDAPPADAPSGGASGSAAPSAASTAPVEDGEALDVV
ncbi:Putative TPR repeat-containing protein R856 [Durusdinium trenchii]|uniref:TPR repeat-containing protein R856 n=1 Tax=Durusdinium trenchii TaxID=1381693 RepID=A0ABP0L2S5_9DINO